VRAAKFHEVTKQVVMTGHLVDGLFITVSSKAWNGMNAGQRQKVRTAAQAAVAFNNENRLKEEAQIVDFLRQQGLQVTTPDVDAFRRAVQQAYANSDFAKTWPKGLVERIAATR
jgi:TRAP-type transport system periplasmic protein